MRPVEKPIVFRRLFRSVVARPSKVFRRAIPLSLAADGLSFFLSNRAGQLEILVHALVQSLVILVTPGLSSHTLSQNVETSWSLASFHPIKRAFRVLCRQ